jgi:hypothetical protein
MIEFLDTDEFPVQEIDAEPEYKDKPKKKKDATKKPKTPKDCHVQPSIILGFNLWGK